jgi:GcrA cell cycle regulator
MSSEIKAWDEDRVAKLIKLWDEGMSGSECAAILGGITRSAVIAKVHRLGLPRRAPTPNRGITLKSGLKIKVVKPPMVAPLVKLKLLRSPLNLAAPVSAKLTLHGLTNKTCRWPQGHRDFTFCGHGPRAGSPYCDYHASMARKPLKQAPAGEQKAHVMVKAE